MSTAPLPGVSLLIPNLWDKDWQQAIENSEGPERSIIAAQAKLAALLRDVHDASATPEMLAWLSLWSRFFGSLSGARGAWAWRARFALRVLSRTVFETGVHLQAVMAPVLASVDDDTAALRETGNGDLPRTVWDEVRRRLQAYTAWCLWNDIELYRFVSRPENLSATFEPETKRDFIKLLGEQREAWEHAMGQQLELVSDQEAAADLERARQRYAERLQRNEAWLHHSALQPWVTKLGDLERSKKGAVSLFALLGLGSNVRQVLGTGDLEFGYSEYKRGSGAVHGSSLEASLLITDVLIAPEFADLGEGSDGLVRGIVTSCNLHWLLLSLVAKHVA